MYIFKVIMVMLCLYPTIPEQGRMSNVCSERNHRPSQTLNWAGFLPAFSTSEAKLPACEPARCQMYIFKVIMVILCLYQTIP